MKKDLTKAIQEYKENHPEVDEIMKKFQLSQEVYDRAIASITIRAPRRRPTYTLTTSGKYNVNVSATT